VHAHVAATLQLGGDQGERLRARAGADDDVCDPELDQPAEEGGGGIRRRCRPARALSSMSGDAAATVLVRSSSPLTGGRLGPRSGSGLGVEGGELRLEATDALVLIGDRDDAQAEEVGVVVGGPEALWRCARPRPTTNHIMPPMTGSSTTMTIHSGLLTPRWRVGGCRAQSTMLYTQKAISNSARGSRMRTTLPS
jgi:hypothetical protein